MPHSISSPNTTKKARAEKASLLEIRSNNPGKRKKALTPRPDTANYRQAIGAIIREFRVRHKWTQEELSTKLRARGFFRCTRTLLSQIESGVALMRSHELFYLRAEFGATFEKRFWSLFHIEEFRPKGDSR